MPEISYFSKVPSFKIPNPRKTTAWLKKICASEKRPLHSLTYVFVRDVTLLEMNKEYLNHNTLTDILSFDLSENQKISGEIYISVERVRENAKTFQQPFESELRRVIAHGLLHFIGYKDKTRQEKAQMRSKEEAYLSLWK